MEQVTSTYVHGARFFKRAPGIPKPERKTRAVQQAALDHAKAQSPVHRFFIKRGDYEYASYVDVDAFVAAYLDMLPRERQMYELLLPDAEMFLYTDVEFVLADDDNSAEQRLIAFENWLRRLVQATGAVYDTGLLRACIGTRPAKAAGLTKHSYHFLYKGLTVRGMEAMNSLVAVYGQHLSQARDETKGTDLLYYDEPTTNGTTRKCIVDFAVYSLYRAMRMVGSTKCPKKDKGPTQHKPKPVRPNIKEALRVLTADGKESYTLSAETVEDNLISHVRTADRLHEAYKSIDMADVERLLQQECSDGQAPKPKKHKPSEGTNKWQPKTKREIERSPDELAVVQQLAAVVKSHGDQASTIGARLPSVNDAQRSTTYVLQTDPHGGRLCATGLFHQSNNGYLVVDTRSGRVMYGCLSERCKQIRHKPLAYGYILVDGGASRKTSTDSPPPAIEHAAQEPESDNADVMDVSEIKGRQSPPPLLQLATVDGKRWWSYSAPVLRPIAETLTDARRLGGPLCRHTIIRAGMKLGKTTRMREHIEELLRAERKTRVLIVSHRKSLAAAYSRWATRLGFVSYSDGPKAYARPLLICQYESLHHLAGAGAPPFDLVLLDEIESTSTNTISKTNGPHSRTNANAFRCYVQSSGCTVALCADAGDRSIGMLGQVLGDANVHLEVNVHRSMRSTMLLYGTSGCHSNTNRWQRGLRDKLQAGGRIAVAVNTVKQADALIEYLRTEGLHLVDPEGPLASLQLPPDASKTAQVRYRLYCSKSLDSYHADFVDVNTAWTRLDLLLYTSKVSCGISFEVADHFDCVFAYGHSSSACPRVLNQMIGRIRHPRTTDVHLCIEQDPVSARTSDARNAMLELGPKECLDFSSAKRLLVANGRVVPDYERSMLYDLEPNPGDQNCAVKWVLADTWMVNVMAHTMVEENQSRRDYFGSAVQWFLRAGHTVRHMVFPPDSAEQVKMDEAAASLAEQTAKAQVQLDHENAPLLDAATAELVQRKIVAGQATPTEKLALVKYRHSRHFAPSLQENDVVDDKDKPDDGPLPSRHSFEHYAKLHRRHAQIQGVEALLRGMKPSQVYLEMERRAGVHESPAHQDFADLRTTGTVGQRLVAMEALATALGLRSLLDTATLVPDSRATPEINTLLQAAAAVLGVSSGTNCSKKRKRTEAPDAAAPRRPTDRHLLWVAINRVFFAWGNATFAVVDKQRIRVPGAARNAPRPTVARRALRFGPVVRKATLLDVAATSLFFAGVPVAPGPGGRTAQTPYVSQFAPQVPGRTLFSVAP